MIEFQNVVKTFPATKQSAAVHAVQDVSLKVETGEIFGVIGYSGAGKSTLIRLINGLEQPTAGQVIVDRQTVNSLGKKDLLKLRQSIGMIFQSYNLLTTATVYQNIVLPLKLIGLKHTVIAERAEKYLKIVGLWDRRGSFPAQLSGGQRQRVAIARALAYEPKILLSDEATSALDPETTESILKLLLKINRELGITIFLITHELDVIQRVCDRVAVMEAGHVVEQGTVVDIFTQPKQAMTKQFVGNNETLGVPADILAPYRQTKQLVLLQFVGDTANTPALAAVASHFKVEPNILAGSMGYLKRSAYGRLLVYLKADKPEQYRDTLAYLQTAGIYVEEVQ